MTWTIRIPRAVPSANDRHCNGRDRVSRALYRKLRNAWAADLIAAARIAGIPAPKGKRSIAITRVMGKGQRAYDFDDLVGGVKPILDAMKPARPGAVMPPYRSGPKAGERRVVKPVPGAGLIYDDSPAWVDVTYRQERGAQAGCIIEIEDVEPRSER
jgi:hypothetical protein